MIIFGYFQTEKSSFSPLNRYGWATHFRSWIKTFWSLTFLPASFSNASETQKWNSKPIQQELWGYTVNVVTGIIWTPSIALQVYNREGKSLNGTLYCSNLGSKFNTLPLHAPTEFSLIFSWSNIYPLWQRKHWKVISCWKFFPETPVREPQSLPLHTAQGFNIFQINKSSYLV